MLVSWITQISFEEKNLEELFWDSREKINNESPSKRFHRVFCCCEMFQLTSTSLTIKHTKGTNKGNH